VVFNPSGWDACTRFLILKSEDDAPNMDNFTLASFSVMRQKSANYNSLNLSRMKKKLLFIAVIAASMCANAQGVWKSTGTEASVAASAEITFTGVTGLKCMHSDVAGVTGKGDSGATNVVYNGVTWDNLAYIQGATNEMYYAFLPAKSGVMDVALKMGSNKSTFVLELNDVTTVEGLDTLTTTYGTFSGIPTASWTAPSVYDTHNNSMGTWNGSAPIQNTGENVYLVISIPVTANKTYVVGVKGSKLMLRGVSLTITTSSANNIPASKATVVSTEYYSLTGARLSQPGRGVNLVKKTMSDGTVSTSKIVMASSMK
jgi:hypothetical protein